LRRVGLSFHLECMRVFFALWRRGKRAWKCVKSKLVPFFRGQTCVEMTLWGAFSLSLLVLREGDTSVTPYLPALSSPFRPQWRDGVSVSVSVSGWLDEKGATKEGKGKGHLYSANRLGGGKGNQWEGPVAKLTFFISVARCDHHCFSSRSLCGAWSRRATRTFSATRWSWPTRGRSPKCCSWSSSSSASAGCHFKRSTCSGRSTFPWSN